MCIRDRDKLDQYDLSVAQSDKHDTIKWGSGFRVNMDSLSGEAKHRKPSQYNAYTDGSKINGQAGSGLVVYHGKNELLTRSYRLPDHATVFQAEIVAIERAATALIESGRSVKYVKIYVDSQAAFLRWLTQE